MILVIIPSFVRDRDRFERFLRENLKCALYLVDFCDLIKSNNHPPQQEKARTALKQLGIREHILFYSGCVPLPLGEWIKVERGLILDAADTRDITNAIRSTAQAAYFNLNGIIDKICPQSILIWGARNLVNKVGLILAQRHCMRVIFFEKGFFPNSYIASFDIPYYRTNSNLWQATKLFNPAVAKEFDAGAGWHFLQSWLSAKESKYPSTLTEEIHSIRASHLLIGQVRSDLQLKSFGRSPDQELFKWFSSESRNDPDMTGIFRLHPYSAQEQRKAIARTVSKLPKLSINEGENLFSVLQRVDKVVTINSTVGLEALLTGKEVIVLDNSAFYRPLLRLSSWAKAAYTDFLVKKILWWSSEGAL